MEPTNLWCKSGEDGKKLISDGMVGFYHSEDKINRRGPFILQFVTQTFICEDGETYLITDLGKCSMPTKKSPEEIRMNLCPTTSTRERRYENCLDYLKRELEIVNPKWIFFVGRSIDGYFNKKLFIKRNPWFLKYKSICSYVPHYSRESQHSGIFNKYCEKNIMEYDSFIKDNKYKIPHMINKYGNSRITEIENGGSVRINSDAHRYLMDSIKKNMDSQLQESDLKMIYYYVSEMGKCKY